MAIIILEGVLFVVLVATGAALLCFVVLYLTPVGTRIRQHQARRRLERAAELACPIHGLRTAEQVVRLPTGEAVCADCYKESLR